MNSVLCKEAFDILLWFKNKNGLRDSSNFI
jgi:hypothetical protein